MFPVFVGKVYLVGDVSDSAVFYIKMKNVQRKSKK